MTKPNESDYGFTNEQGWPSWRSEYEFLKAYRAWDKERKAPKESGGRPRTRPIHESWNEVLKKFKPIPGKSQGAFCDWVELNHLAKLNRSTFSAMQIKPIKPEIEKLINKWLYIGDGQGLDGSMNTNQHRVKKEVQNGQAE